MQTKLILNLDDQLVEQVQVYADEHGKTIDQIVADYLSQIVASTSKETDKYADLPPITRSLIGALKESNLDEDDYHAYLEEKYR